MPEFVQEDVAQFIVRKLRQPWLRHPDLRADYSGERRDIDRDRHPQFHVAPPFGRDEGEDGQEPLIGSRERPRGKPARLMPAPREEGQGAQKTAEPDDHGNVQGGGCCRGMGVCRRRRNLGRAALAVSDAGESDLDLPGYDGVRDRSGLHSPCVHQSQTGMDRPGQQEAREDRKPKDAEPMASDQAAQPWTERKENGDGESEEQAGCKKAVTGGTDGVHCLRPFLVRC